MNMRDYLNTAVFNVAPSLIRVFAYKAATIPGCISLTLGEPDFDTPAQITSQVATAFENHETHYIHNAGLMALREKIAKFENEHYGMDFNPTEILVTCGATEAIYTAFYGILNPGDEVIIPIPAFTLYDDVVKLCRGVPVYMDTTEDGFQLNREKLLSCITEKTKAIIINSPNNPTGCVLTKESLDILHDVVKDKPIFVICDDVYRQLVYGKEYHSFMEYRDLREQLILVESFSKPYAMTGWRMGYLGVSDNLRERLELVHQYLITSTPAPFQRACMEALDYDPTEFRNKYLERRDYVLDRLAKMGMEVTKPEGAFYVFPSIQKYGMTSSEFCNRLMEEEKLALTPGICFGPEGNVRISYCYSNEVLEEGMNRLEKFVKKIENEK